MGMSIEELITEELITFCEEEEQNHRVKAKRADDASGYTRSKDKNVKTAVAIREEVYGDFYKQIADTMRKYQKIREIVFSLQFCSTDRLEHEAIMKICEVLEDGNDA